MEMKQQLAYQKLKNYIQANGYSLSQVKSVKAAQVNTFLGTSYDETLLGNALAYIVTEMTEAEHISDKQFFRDQFDSGARIAVKNRWPDFEVTVEYIKGQRVFVFWRYGKPEVIDGD